jgi:para-nitrobenzyl esterase
MKQTIIFGNIITMGEITKQKIFAAILMGGMVTVLTSCTDREDNPVQKPQTVEEKMKSLYGENKEITNGDFDQSLAVKCINGTFVGKKTDNIIAFKGIPFVGQQPVGDLRWKAPVEVVPDDRVYEAYYYAKSARQRETSSEKAGYYYQSEDCLYLNVWKADEMTDAKKPVMVWIHGGAFEYGGTVDPLYNGHNLVKENPDVIFVSITYRLGIFGFLHLSHLPDGKDYPDAQNLGIMDEMMALKWIHENIAGFGGDPDNVTIFGESAGGGSVTVLPLVEGSHKYFKKVIAQSGSPVFTRSSEQAIDCTNKLMEALGCKTVADLQKVDVEKFLETSAIITLRVMPERDGKYLPLDPYAAYENGVAKDIDIMQGCNKDEMNYFMVSGGGPEPFTAWGLDRKAKVISQMTDEEKALIESFYNDIPGESYEKICRLYDQGWFIAPLIRLSECQTMGGGKSFTYLFTPESSIPLMKSGHAVEVSTVLNNPEVTDFTGRIFDPTFSKTMRRMWVQFAKTGIPSLSADQSPDGKAYEWPLYDLTDKNIMIFDEFNIHPEKESQRKMVDWEKTYFLTKYYCI